MPKAAKSDYERELTNFQRSLNPEKRARLIRAIREANPDKFAKVSDRLLIGAWLDGDLEKLRATRKRLQEGGDLAEEEFDRVEKERQIRRTASAMRAAEVRHSMAKSRPANEAGGQHTILLPKDDRRTTREMPARVAAEDRAEVMGPLEEAAKKEQAEAEAKREARLREKATKKFEETTEGKQVDAAFMKKLTQMQARQTFQEMLPVIGDMVLAEVARTSDPAASMREYIAENPEEVQSMVREVVEKRKRGRPKGSKDSAPRRRRQPAPVSESATEVATSEAPEGYTVEVPTFVDDDETQDATQQDLLLMRQHVVEPSQARAPSSVPIGAISMPLFSDTEYEDDEERGESW